MTSTPLTRLEAASIVKAARVATGTSWTALAEAVGMSLEWSTSALLGQHTLTAAQISSVAKVLDLDADVCLALALPPVRTAIDTTDPLIYRLTEAVQVWGEAIKELTVEEFGDGIISAIDFTLGFARVEDPKGDRVNLTLSGKFLSYKTF
jgi:cyanate lyase